MTTKQLPVDFSEVQGTIYRLALSLDSFLVNGIPYGVLQRGASNDLLQETAERLLNDLANLESLSPHASVTRQPRIAELLASLRARCQQLVDLVAGLGSFRTLPLEQVRSTVSQIPLLRGECVQLIQELEECFQTPKRFYQTRPAHSTAAVNDFLLHLPQLFAEEWNASK